MSGKHEEEEEEGKQSCKKEDGAPLSAIPSEGSAAWRRPSEPRLELHPGLRIDWLPRIIRPTPTAPLSGPGLWFGRLGCCQGNPGPIFRNEHPEMTLLRPLPVLQPR